MKPRARRERELVRNRRRGIMPYALLSALLSDPFKVASVNVARLRPAERVLLYCTLERELIRRMVLETSDPRVAQPRGHGNG